MKTIEVSDEVYQALNIRIAYRGCVTGVMLETTHRNVVNHNDAIEELLEIAHSEGL